MSVCSSVVLPPSVACRAIKMIGGSSTTHTHTCLLAAEEALLAGSAIENHCCRKSSLNNLEVQGEDSLFKVELYARRIYTRDENRTFAEIEKLGSLMEDLVEKRADTAQRFVKKFCRSKDESGM